ncbi:hypothetical protein MmarC5_1290 [Methanococcus maripaludis C5]|uniref:Uncharacterized protein n=1 Tax=Methanococcus maripaludis (strain C5 / ATCC BAA-1333) TaxID=402880 RepID=A4FZF4_METM5|nr:hypothetical protein [Methanococcus maripaludis]ABO35588.1 hypothetical protein MmarC5_1290 [Methanococcus maripaludis C5]
MEGNGDKMEIKKSPDFTEKFSPAILVCPFNKSMLMMDVLRNNLKIINDEKNGLINRENNWESSLRIYFTVETARAMLQDLDKYLKEIDEKVEEFPKKIE